MSWIGIEVLWEVTQKVNEYKFKGSRVTLQKAMHACIPCNMRAVRFLNMCDWLTTQAPMWAVGEGGKEEGEVWGVIPCPTFMEQHALLQDQQEA